MKPTYLLAWMVLLLGCAREVQLSGEDPSTAQRPITIDLPAPPSAVRARLVQELPRVLASQGHFPGFEVATAEDPLFPAAEVLQLEARGEPELARYTTLSAEQRRLDLFLHDPQDRYWESSYTSAGAPVRFRCDFILHLAAHGSAATRVTVLEVLPRVWPRDHFLLLGRHGPGVYRDIRVVAPTARDRTALAALIAGLFAD